MAIYLSAAFRSLEVVVISMIVLAGYPAFAQEGPSAACGALFAEGQYGPYDYRKDLDKLPIVLGAHFTPVVESLLRGTTGQRPGPDIDYTLRAIPNNPRALLAMMRLGEKEKTSQPSGSRYTVECWFERAIRFRPDDHVVRMIYTSFLTKNNRKPEAMQQLEMVLGSATDNPFTYFNVGLLYFDMDEPGKALIQAHKAMELGLTKTELRDKLQAVGKWTEPAEVSAPGAPISPSGTASAPQKP